MEEMGGKREEESFLEQIANIDSETLQWNMETIKLYNECGSGNTLSCRFSPSLIEYMVPPKPRKDVLPLEGRDLGIGGIVKHYSYSSLADILSRRKSNCEIVKFSYGSFYRASIEYCGKETPVTIKNWELSFPPRLQYKLYPAMLYNDIIIGRKKRPNVPKLIGYSIDKILTVIYDLNPNGTLNEALFGSPELTSQFGWKKRLRAAIGVGLAVESFHADNIFVGCINSHKILIDQELNVHLCNFSLQPHVENMVSVEVNKLLPLRYEGSGRLYLEDMNDCSKLERDIYSYGCLLLELTSKPTSSQHQSTKHLLPPDKLSNFVDESFFEVGESEVKEITSLATSCRSVDPGKRPKIGDVVKCLESLAAKCDLGHRDKIYKT